MALYCPERLFIHDLLIACLHKIYMFVCFYRGNFFFFFFFVMLANELGYDGSLKLQWARAWPYSFVSKHGRMAPDWI